MIDGYQIFHTLQYYPVAVAKKKDDPHAEDRLKMVDQCLG